MKKKVLLSIVVPCYNEERNIPLIVERFNQVTHHQLETPFSDLSKEYINIFQQWVDSAFYIASRFPRAGEEWKRLARLVRSQEFQVWFDSAGYFELEFGPTAAFYNAANSFHNYIRALVNYYDENRRVSPGEVKASLEHLRLSINSVVDALVENSGWVAIGSFGPNTETEDRLIEQYQHTALAQVRQEIIPLLLG